MGMEMRHYGRPCLGFEQSVSVNFVFFFAGGPVLPVQVEVAGWPQSKLLTRTCKPVRLGSSLSHECNLALANASLPLQKPAHSVVRVFKTHHCFIPELAHLS
jgi:hypothetical protein